MCMNCVTNAEFLATSGLLAGSGAAVGVDRLRGILGFAPRVSRAERRHVSYAKSAEYLASLGLEAHAVLGEAPAAPARTPAVATPESVRSRLLALVQPSSTAPVAAGATR